MVARWEIGRVRIHRRRQAADFTRVPGWRTVAPIDAWSGGKFPSGVVARWTTHRLCVGRKRGEPDRGNERRWIGCQADHARWERARWPTWSPDGRRIAYYVESSVSAIWVTDLANAAEAKLFDSGLTRTLLDWSPDGKEIAFIRGVGNKLGIDALERGVWNRAAGARRRTRSR